MGVQGIGVLISSGVQTTPPFVGTFCRSVGVQSTAQPWHTDPLTSYNIHLTFQEMFRLTEVRMTRARGEKAWKLAGRERLRLARKLVKVRTV